MNYYDSDLQRLQQKIMEKKKLDAKYADLLEQQKELEERTAELEKIMLDEQEDVDRLNGRSLAAFFYRVSGRAEEKLSKEEEEARAAALKFDAAYGELQAVKADIDHCERALSQIQKAREEYDRLLEEKKKQIKKRGDGAAARILELEQRLAFLENQQREVREALEAGQKAYDIAEQVVHKLEHVKGWSTVDLIGGSILTDVVKYNGLNEIQEMTKELQGALRGFRTELADVKEEISGDIQINLGGFLTFADYYEDRGLKGFANWYEIQAKEEMDHAMAIRRYLLQNGLSQVTDLDADWCRSILLKHIIDGKVYRDDIPAGEPGLYGTAGTGGKTFTTLAGTQVWVYVVVQEKDGIVQHAAKPIYINFLESNMLYAVASGDIEPDNCVVHALDYNFTLGDEE